MTMQTSMKRLSRGDTVGAMGAEPAANVVRKQPLNISLTVPLNICDLRTGRMLIDPFTITEV